MRFLLAALGATVLCLIGASGAEAGTFTIGDCPSASNHTRTAGPWEWVGLVQSPSFILKQECASGPGDWLGLASVVFGPLVNGFGVDTQGTPLTIRHLRVWWRAFGSPSQSSFAEISVRNTAGYPLPGFAVADTGSFWDTTGGAQELEFPPAEEAGIVQIGERCASECNSQSWATYEGIPLVIQLYGADLTLADNTPPSVTLTSALEASGPVTGPISIGFHATDPVGIKRSELLVDGAPVASHDYGASCSYTTLKPCPGTESDQLSVEGASLPEGVHQLAVRVEDAAGNTSLSPSRSITSARPPVPNGNPCPIPAISVSLAGKGPVPYGEPAAVRGRLACGPTPIAGASIHIVTSTLAGAHAAALGTIATAADGSFTYPVPPGPSRRLTFTYTAYSNQTTPAAQAALAVRVKPRITLKIAPRRTHYHGRITWSGRVEGGPYPTSGVALQTQALNVILERVRRHGRWKTVRHEEWLTFDDIVAHDGNISYHWKFRHTSRPTIYTFRVATPPGGAASYEYAPAASNPVSVLVN